MKEKLYAFPSAKETTFNKNNTLDDEVKKFKDSN
jgi:hypothetical protein